MLLHDGLGNRRAGRLWLFSEDKLTFEWGYLSIELAWRRPQPIRPATGPAPALPPADPRAARAVERLAEARDRPFTGVELTRELHRVLVHTPARLSARVLWRNLLTAPRPWKRLEAIAQFYAHMLWNPHGDGCTCWRPS